MEPWVLKTRPQDGAYEQGRKMGTKKNKEHFEKNNQESLFSELNSRLRNIQSSPSGLIYLLTDGPNGKLIKVLPKDL